MRLFAFPCTTVLLLIGTVGMAQEARKTPPMTAAGRLGAAKTAFVKNAGGNSIPFRVIESTLEGWGRFTLVEAPEKADLIVEVSAPAEGGGISVSSSTDHSPLQGQTSQSTTTTKQVSSSQVKMVVLDGRSKVPLWSGTEQPKFAVKQKAKEDNLVEAAQRLVAKFRQRLEMTTVL
jgi:hypothetical protein